MLQFAAMRLRASNRVYGAPAPVSYGSPAHTDYGSPAPDTRGRVRGGVDYRVRLTILCGVRRARR